MMGGEASGPGRRRGGITNNSKQAKHETHARGERAERWHGLLYCNLLQSAAPLAETGPPQPVGRWQTTTVTLRV